MTGSTLDLPGNRKILKRAAAIETNGKTDWTDIPICTVLAVKKPTKKSDHIVGKNVQRKAVL